MLQVELPEVLFFLAPVAEQPLDLGNAPIDLAGSKDQTMLVNSRVAARWLDAEAEDIAAEMLRPGNA